ncbi:MAG: hypothetical protein DGJ47_000005 [Rickettsiaceae bacterium]
MQVILTKSVRKLGKVGETVSVASGFARNYLLPQEFAIRATESNIAKFESLKKDLEKKNSDNIESAKKAVVKLKDKHLTFAVQSSADGRLFGSIGTKTLAKRISDEFGLDLKYNNIILDDVIKFNGVYETTIVLHPEVMTTILIVIAKTEEEAQAALQDHKESKNKPKDEEIEQSFVSDENAIQEEESK